MKKNDTKRVLLYSEDRKQNEQVREAVLRSGYEGKLLFAENKVTALEQLRAVPVDLLIASIWIRRKSGGDFSDYRFLEEFRSMDQQKNAKLIIFSDANDDLEYMVNRLKCNLYLVRPMFVEEMKDEIADFIRLNLGITHLQSTERRYFFRYRRKVYVLSESKILMYESTDKVGFVITSEEKIPVQVQDLRDIRGIRGSKRFVRCNACDYVNIDHIREYDRQKLILEGVKNPVYFTRAGWKNLEQIRKLTYHNDGGVCD